MARERIVLDRTTFRNTIGRGKFTVPEFQAKTGLGKQAATVRVKRAVEDGVLEAVGHRQTGERGRPPVEYRVTKNPPRTPKPAAEPEAAEPEAVESE